jgi:iron complex outermembrane recepter protein
MAYYTFSQGFRPGGFNRTSSTPYAPPSLAYEAEYIKGDKTTYQYQKPAGYNSDNLINNEIGFKSEWLDHRLLVNLSAYYMHWNDIQLSLFDPVHLGNTTFNVNGPSYTIKGIEVQFIARIIEGLSVEGSSSINAPEQTNSPCLTSVGQTGSKKSSNNPTPAGACITQVNGAFANDPNGAYASPFGVNGARPAFSPPWMFNIRARYDWSTSAGYKPFAWIGASHIGPMSNEPANFPDGNSPAQNPPTTTLLRYQIPSYTTYDGAIGVAKDQWTAQISGTNLSNQYGPTNISSGQFIKSEVPLRPRVIMFQMGYKF